MLDELKRRLLGRQDVADAEIVGDKVRVTREDGAFYMACDYNDAVSFLDGPDHLIGMAVCGCRLCGGYRGPR